MRWLLLAAILVLIGLQQASAFYDPSTQRWLNRDPIGEAGFRKIAKRERGTADRAQLYAYVRNTVPNKVDPRGLAIWLCTTPTVGFPFGGLGRHSYLWDDRSPIADHSCSMQGSSSSQNTSDPTDIGPIGHGGSWLGGSVVEDGYWAYGDTECHIVPGSEGNENAIMDHCRECANPILGPIPGVSDCHNRCEKILRDSGFPTPPHRRFNQDDWKFFDWYSEPGIGI